MIVSVTVHRYWLHGPRLSSGGAETGNEAIVLVVMERNVHCTVQLGIDQNVWCKVLVLTIGKFLPLKYFRLCTEWQKLNTRNITRYVAELSRDKIFLTRKFKARIIFNAKTSQSTVLIKMCGVNWVTLFNI